MKIVAFLILLFLSALTYAKSLGVVGETFPVAEVSFLQMIQERLQVLSQNGELDALQTRWLQTVSHHVNRPQPLGLSRALKHRSFFHEPLVILGQSITNEKGAVLFAKGTRVNALERLPAYQPCWLFFNGDDKAQVQWAMHASSQCRNPKLILTGGAVNEAEAALNQVIYFDQAGRLTQKLHIEFVPALVMREQNRLRIDEVFIGEHGHAL